MTDVASDLKPCPHCGSSDLQVVFPERQVIGSARIEVFDCYVACKSCFSCGGQRADRTSAIAAWNRRTDTAVVGEEADAIALGASELACYEYPGEDQGPLRAAFIAGAVSRSPTGGREAGLEEARAIVLRKANELSDCSVGYACDDIVAAIDAALLPSEQKARS